MGPTWVLSAPDGPHVGPTNLAIRVVFCERIHRSPLDSLTKVQQYEKRFHFMTAIRYHACKHEAVQDVHLQLWSTIPVIWCNVEFSLTCCLLLWWQRAVITLNKRSPGQNGERFADGILKRRTICNFIHISLKLIFMDIIGNKLALDQGMAWYRTGATSLPERMMTQ